MGGRKERTRGIGRGRRKVAVAEEENSKIPPLWCSCTPVSQNNEGNGGSMLCVVSLPVCPSVLSASLQLRSGNTRPSRHGHSSHCLSLPCLATYFSPTKGKKLDFERQKRIPPGASQGSMVPKSRFWCQRKLLHQQKDQEQFKALPCCPGVQFSPKWADKYTILAGEIRIGNWRLCRDR